MASVAQRKRNRKARLNQERRQTTGQTVLVEALTLTESVTEADVRDSLSGPLDEWAGTSAAGRYCWIRTTGQDDDGQRFVIVEVSGDSTDNGAVDPGNYRVDFTLDVDTLAVELGAAGEVKVKTEYIPTTPPPPAGDQVEADLYGDTVTLTEAAAVDDDGTISLKVIEPGWGTSGYYPPEVLEADGPAAFPAGTHMYWDHPTETDEAERPERSLRDLAAVTVTEAAWDPDGPEGPGLYADAQVFTRFADVVEEMAPHIGVSIRAAGFTEHGEAEGRTGPIVESIGPGRSIDFVTAAGAGGQVLALFESARTRPHRTDPPAPRPTPDPLKETETMDLTEAKQQITTLTGNLTEAQALGELAAAERDRLATENARLTEARNIAAAKAISGDALTESALSNAARNRVIDQVSANPPLTEAGDVDTAKLTEAVTAAEDAELSYLQENGLMTGRPRNLGDTTPAAAGDRLDESTDAFKDQVRFYRDVMGLDEAAAAVAARGR